MIYLWKSYSNGDVFIFNLESVYVIRIRDS